jgi:hypothetical protein
MGHAYTPGLRVASKCLVRRERILPLKGSLLTEMGARVSATQVVARTELPGDIEIINLAFDLGCEAKDMPGKLSKGEGDPVEAGEILARTKGFLGMGRNEVAAPCTGTIETVSPITGKVLIRKAPLPVEVRAYVDGTVVEVREAEGVVVETPAAFIQGIIGVGGETHGPLVSVVGSPDEALEPKHILPEHKGAIVAGGALVTLDAIRRAAEVGVLAIVAGGIHDVDLEAYLGYALGVAITGHEDVPVTIVITEGFGEIAMAKRTFELLQSLQGKGASVNGATQIRAGVIRPEVVIPVDTTAAAEEEGGGEMHIGDTVRIIREPFFGVLAEVVALRPELIAIETEAKVRSLEVKLPDGRTETLPRANVEVIQS